MPQTPAALFALEVVPGFRQLLIPLSKEPGLKVFCDVLAIQLEHLERRLKENAHPTSSHDSKKLLEVLYQLEKALQWPAGFAAPHKSRPAADFDRTWYPNLQRLLTSRPYGRKNIREFASSSAAHLYHKRLRKSLKAFEEPVLSHQQPGLSDLRPVGGQEEHANDFQPYIKDLHAVLSENCLCLVSEYSHIAVNLRLNGYEKCEGIRDGVDVDEASFSLFFLDHPHHSSGTCQWQDTTIRVAKKRATRFELNDDAAPHSGQKERIITMDQFCDSISGRGGYQLQLVARDGALIWKDFGPRSRKFSLHASSISLLRILDEQKPTKKMRLILCYHLARSVWQFYGSDWTASGWHKDSVHFMFQHDGSSIFVNEPFLSTNIGSTMITETALNNNFRVHLFPDILALGILLIEIELGLKIEDHFTPNCYDINGQLTINAKHIAASELYENPDLWEEKETFVGLRNVIKVCLYPDELKPHVNNVNDIREKLWKCIVSPLRSFFEAAWGSPETSRVEALRFESDSTTFPASAGMRHTLPVLATRPALAAQNISSSCPSSVPPSGAVAGADQPTTSTPWFDQLHRLNSVLRCKPGERDDGYRPTKIAILDTGLAAAYPSPAIGGYIDFVNGQNTVFQDSTGHGTNAFLLTQKVYAHAEIYIGRVWEDSHATSNTATLMCRAIRHALEAWKVDIIILPSGFQAEHEDLFRAIEEANAAHVLVFAAASNHGNLTQIAFPARLYGSYRIFCMFASNADARSSPSFNPSPLPEARNSFAVLGENITLPDREPLSGTSYSAVIGAALAGRIQDFSRQQEIRNLMPKADRLKRVDGMAAVFKKMSRTDNSYQCLVPWRILPYFDDETILSMRAQMRECACDKINAALNEMYGA